MFTLRLSLNKMVVKSDQLTARVCCCPPTFGWMSLLSEISAFGEFNVIRTDRNDGRRYRNKTYVELR